jgi:hypothetical protein
VATNTSSAKNTGKMNLQSILNKNSSHAHMKLEFGVLGIATKLVKYVVYLSETKGKKREYIFLFTRPIVVIAFKEFLELINY